MSETDEPMVAQQHRNQPNDPVAQPPGGIRSTHIRSSDVQGDIYWWALSVTIAAVFSGALGCASGKPSDGLHPDARPSDGAASSCADDCAGKGQVCSFGRCTSSACAMAELTLNTAVGCLFYTLQADNVTSDEAAATTFLVTGQGADETDVQLQQLLPTGPAATWIAVAETMIAGGGVSTRFSVSSLEVTATGTTAQAAIRISSDRPVTVAEIESDDVVLPATSSGGTMVLPLQSLGRDYRAVTYPQQTSPDVAQTMGSRGGAARVMVVGTQAGTQVTLTPVGSLAGADGGSQTVDAGASTVVTLGDGDVFQVYTEAEGEDLTGAEITASAPVAVFSGNISTSYGSQVVGINSADMAHEQMPPVSAWSAHYIAAALTPQASIGCTSFFGADGGSIWRVLAARDGTQVSLSGPAIGPSVTQNPLTLNAGDSASLVEVGNFAVDANYPVLLTQGIDCEPSLSLAIGVGTTHLYTDLPFAVPPSFDLLLGVVRPIGAEVDLDGVQLPSGDFQAVNSQYEVATVSLPACAPTDGSGVCTHRLHSTVGFGMSLRGMDVSSSYVLTPPLLVPPLPS